MPRFAGFPLLAGTAILAVLAAPPSARADKLDGHWCHPDGRRLSIDGPRIVTPGGASLDGDYRRHTFSYTVPADEPGAGASASIVQLNDQHMQFAVGDAPVEDWSRCGAPSS